MSDDLAVAAATLHSLKAQLQAAAINPVHYSGERLLAIGQGLAALAMRHGVRLQVPLHPTGRGEFNLIAMPPQDSSDCDSFAAFVQDLNACGERTGMARAAIQDSKNGRCCIDHFDAERIVLANARAELEVSTVLSSIQAFLASGRGLDTALSIGAITAAQVVVALHVAVNGPVAKSLTFKTHHRPQGDLQRCETPFGVYEIRHTPLGAQASFFSGHDVSGLLERVGGTVDQAMQACREDFHQRVIDCLSEPSSPRLVPTSPENSGHASTESPARRARP